MREDDLDKGLQNIKDILLRLETQVHEAQLLKEFPRPAHAEPPAGEPKPVTQPVRQDPEPPAVNEPVREVFETEPPAGPPAEEPKPGLQQPVPQIPERPALSGPAPEVPETGAPAAARPEEAASGTGPVPQAAEDLKKEPEPEIVEKTVPAEPSPDVPEPGPRSAPQAALQPVVSEPDETPARRTAGSKIKTLLLFCLGLMAAAAIYQFGFNGSKYRFKQAYHLERIGDKTNAVAAYERLILKYPGTPEAAAGRYSVGNIKNERGEPGAIEDYRQFLGMAPAGDPRIPDAKFKIAESRFKAGAIAEAAKLYDDADIRASVYSQKARERLEQIKTAETQAEEAKAKAAAEAAKAAASAKAKLARSILMTNRKHLAARTAGKAAAVKTVSLNERYTACSPVWLAEQRQTKPEAGLIAAKKAYDCDALKASLAVCEGSGEKTRAIKARTAEERAAKVQSVVKDWTVQKQQNLDKKILSLYEENRCAELLELVSQSGEEEAPEGF